MDNRPVRPIPIFCWTDKDEAAQLRHYRAVGYRGKLEIIRLKYGSREYAPTFYKYYLQYVRAIETVKKPSF